MHFLVPVILIFADNSGSHFLLHVFCLASEQVENLPANTRHTGDVSSIPGPGRYAGGANGNPLQYFCLENPMDRGVWQATVSEVAKSQMWLNDWAQAQSMVMCVLTQNLRCGKCDKKHGKTQITK